MILNTTIWWALQTECKHSRPNERSGPRPGHRRPPLRLLPAPVVGGPLQTQLSSGSVGPSLCAPAWGCLVRGRPGRRAPRAPVSRRAHAHDQLSGRGGGASPHEADDLLWTLDPIDGTVNYSAGIPCAPSPCPSPTTTNRSPQYTAFRSS